MNSGVPDEKQAPAQLYQFVGASWMHLTSEWAAHRLGELQAARLGEGNEWPSFQRLAHMVPVTISPTCFINHTAREVKLDSREEGPRGAERVWTSGTPWTNFWLVHEALSVSRRGCSLLPEHHVVNLNIMLSTWNQQVGRTRQKLNVGTSHFYLGVNRGKIPRKATGLYRDQMKRLLKWILARRISQEPRHEASVNKFTRLKCDRVTSWPWWDIKSTASQRKKTFTD